jgi:hypothetical protein
MNRLTYLRLIATDGHGRIERTSRAIANALGIDPWDVNLREALALARAHESVPVSRFRWGSPCRFVRTIDVIVHVVLPAMLVEGHPTWAVYLRTTSPRWGRTWRHW